MKPTAREAKEGASSNRTFAIVSHPDAGKTTVTEKLLLFGGAIQMAGTVKARKSKRYATSDWMEIEKQRGISVTSSVMKFRYGGLNINLLDTPGHKDFSEDTYRVLTAVDSVLMVIDGAKGVEEQTVKLIEVCRMRRTPVITFVNKFDRECKEPFELISEIEEALKMDGVPLTWPIGMGREFQGVFDLERREALLFKSGGGLSVKTEGVSIKMADRPSLKAAFGEYTTGKLEEDIELIEGAGMPFDKEEYLSGNLTPVFFGSAINGFGLFQLLRGFTGFAPRPLARETEQRTVEPDEGKLSAFVFKIQANMDLQHRDRIAFVRICSGIFEKGMKVYHSRQRKFIKINNTLSFMAQDRASVEKAFPGDIVGIYDSGRFRIGDSLTEGETLEFKGIPHFSPEHFFRVKLENPLKLKQLEKGLDQLSEEGATQVFRKTTDNLPVLGVVGVLQIEIIKFRLLNEYGVEGNFERIPYGVARWYRGRVPSSPAEFEKRYADHVAVDTDGRKVFLAASDWDVDFARKKFGDLEFYDNSDLTLH